MGTHGTGDRPAPRIDVASTGSGAYIRSMASSAYAKNLAALALLEHEIFESADLFLRKYSGRTVGQCHFDLEVDHGEGGSFFSKAMTGSLASTLGEPLCPVGLVVDYYCFGVYISTDGNLPAGSSCSRERDFSSVAEQTRRLDGDGNKHSPGPFTISPIGARTSALRSPWLLSHSRTHFGASAFLGLRRRNEVRPTRVRSVADAPVIKFASSLHAGPVPSTRLVRLGIIDVCEMTRD